VAAACLLLPCGRPAQGGDAPPEKRPAWALDEALNQLAYHPEDVYLQYVALQLARRQNRVEEVAGQVERTIWQAAGPNVNGRGASADLFSAFTGALAVQESLQLDTMRGGPNRRGRPPRPVAEPVVPGQPAPPEDPAKAKRRAERVAVNSLTGPTVQSHPWAKMLGGKNPDVGPLARCVPEDFYLVEFRSVAKLMETVALGDLWGDHVFTQALGEARSRVTVARLKRQLGLGAIKPEALDALGVEGVAVTGSDLYVAEGSDVTLIVRTRRPEALRLLNDLSAVAGPAAGATRTAGTHAGVAFTHAATPDGSLDVYTAEPEPGLHVRGNSLPAFRRVLEAVRGSDAEGHPVRRLGESTEFRYIRTLLPRGAAEEDGLVYLSDPFIRRIVGPQLKLTERRRLLAYNHLRMIGHACLLFRTEHGRAPKSLEELAQAGCAPGVFGQGDLAGPEGSGYSLSADGMSGVCARYGRSDALTPCSELPLTEVTGEEADEYKAFLDDYNQYWRTYFDPIAVRVQVSPERYRLETLVLPLIDNSVYTALAGAVGGKKVTLDALPASKRSIFSLAVHFNKERIFNELRLDEALSDKNDVPQPAGRTKSVMQSVNDLKQVGLAMHNYHDANGQFPTQALRDKQGKPLLSWRVAILPYIEQEPLYKEFHLDEPWDSEHNKKLIAKMPPLYHGPNANLAAEGKTTYLVPVGPDTIFPAGGDGMRMAAITDGTSNTILAVEAADERAAVWTKPDDLPVDPKEPLKGLTRPGQDGFLALMADGSTRYLRATIDPKKLAALFTRAGGEPVTIESQDERSLGGPQDLFGMMLPDVFQGVDKRLVRRFLRDGLGEEVTVHLHDTPRMLDLDLGGAFGPAGGGLGALGVGAGPAALGIGLLVQFLTGPVSVAVPVRDTAAVDEFLDAVDRLVAEAPLRQAGDRLGPVGIGSDFYRVELPAPHKVRCFVVKVFGLKWRVFWGRIGNGLYLANRPFILQDVAEAEAAAAKAPAGGPAPTAHAQIRLRPENWREVLPGFRLGWAEADREACRANLSLVANVARGWDDRRPAAADAAAEPALLDRVARMYGTRPFCPEGGRYLLSADGRTCRCSVHGGDRDPRQPAAPTEASATGRLMKGFGGLTAALSFADDGLRAVVTVERK
jgi:hypothetical protein